MERNTEITEIRNEGMFVYGKVEPLDWWNDLIKKKHVYRDDKGAVFYSHGEVLRVNNGDHLVKLDDKIIPMTRERYALWYDARNNISGISDPLDRFVKGEIDNLAFATALLEEANAKISRLEQANERLNTFVESVRDLLAEI